MARVKNLPPDTEKWVRSLGQEDPLDEEMAVPFQYSCLENPMDRGPWQATGHGVTKSQTRLSERAHTQQYARPIQGSTMKKAKTLVTGKRFLEFSWDKLAS